jgi:protein-S-isoprenylcysteine O-methyltransferase Ste14
LFGLKGDPHFSVFHFLNYFAIGGGSILLNSAWPVLLAAQKEGRLATTAVYASIRHPQYVGFIVIMLGFLLQSPTILTLVMFPFLVAMYVHLAKTEEAEARVRFGQDHALYAATVPGWLPRLGHAEASHRQAW